MFERRPVRGGTASPVPPALTAADVVAFVEQLPSLQLDLPDAQLIDLVSSLEAAKGAVAAAQARVSVAFADSQVERQRSRGVATEELGRGVGAQLALARHESPSRGSRHLGLARALVGGELPHTMAHLSAGRTSEWRATIVCQETACLTVEQRREVDAALAEELPTLGDARLRGRARALAVKLDNAAAAQRAAKAESARRVTLRPAPTTMVNLTALLPVAQGVAALAALRAAAADREPGDTRTVDQICADVLVERVTGQPSADAVPVEVHLVMPVDGLFPPAGPHGAGGTASPAESGRQSAGAAGPSGMAEPGGSDPGRAAEPSGVGDAGGSDPSLAVEPAVLGGQVLPAGFARPLLERCADAGASLWLRRLFTSPDGADLVALDSRRREFTGMLRRLVELRDQTCRTPWCDAPIRHIDHVVEARHGGDTSAGNGRGTCAGCNYAREAPGWSAEVVHDGPRWGGASQAGREPPDAGGPGPRPSPIEAARPGPPHTVRLTTPTGHAYDSTSPTVLPGRLRGTVVRDVREHRSVAARGVPVELAGRAELSLLETCFGELLSA